MQTIAAIFQPFILIALGFVLSKLSMFPRSLWDGVEKLVYYVLFPPLLFNSVANAQFEAGQTGVFLIGGVFAMSTGVLMAWLVSRLAPVDPLTDASVRQTGYRFNSYICFALALSFYGKEGLALAALLTGFWVPISSALAVADLAQAGRGRCNSVKGIVKSIVTNPLIVATVAGLVANGVQLFGGPTVPALVTDVFASLGSASVATALMAIGAGIAVEDMKSCRRLIALSTIQRLVALPAVAWVVAWLVGMNEVQTGALMCYALVPTANSCYILAVRMGGNGPVVSDLISVEVVASLLTIPVWFMTIFS